MNTLFADTSFYVAVANRRDVNHERAMGVLATDPARIVTTEYVLVEVGNWFSKSASRANFLRALAIVRGDGRTEVRPASAALFDRGVDLFASRPDKDWSLTDCISFVVMGDLGLTDALTADRHFTQAGFRPLLG